MARHDGLDGREGDALPCWLGFCRGDRSKSNSEVSRRASVKGEEGRKADLVRREEGALEAVLVGRLVRLAHLLLLLGVVDVGLVDLAPAQAEHEHEQDDKGGGWRGGGKGGDENPQRWGFSLGTAREQGGQGRREASKGRRGRTDGDSDADAGAVGEAVAAVAAALLDARRGREGKGGSASSGLRRMHGHRGARGRPPDWAGARGRT